jgi:hypothetical protein
MLYTRSPLFNRLYEQISEMPDRPGGAAALQGAHRSAAPLLRFAGPAFGGP